MPLKLYATIGAAILIAGLLWHDHIGWQKLKAAKAEATQLQATLAGERQNRAIEQADRRRADAAVTSLQAKLDDINRRASESAPVVLCKRARVPSATGEGLAASVVGSATDTGRNEGPLRDIGSALGAARREAESNAARYEALIKWESERTH